jgi:hypothetical protein
VGDRWGYVGERVRRVFQYVIFVETYDRNSPSMVIPAGHGWSTKEKVRGVEILDVGGDGDT